MKYCRLLFILPLIVPAVLSAQVKSVSVLYGAEYIPNHDQFAWSDQTEITLNDQSRWELGIPGVAVSWSGASGTDHTLESMPLRFSHEVQEEYFTLNDERFDVGKLKINRFDSYTRYRFGIFHITPGEVPISLFLELSGTLRAGWEGGSPSESYYFPYQELDISLAPGIIPGIRLDLGEKGFITLSLPVEPAEFEWSRLHEDNPQLTENERTTGTLSIRPFYRWMGRFGVGVRL